MLKYWLNFKATFRTVDYLNNSPYDCLTCVCLLSKISAFVCESQVIETLLQHYTAFKTKVSLS